MSNPNRRELQFNLPWAQRRILSLVDQFYSSSSKPVQLTTIGRLVGRQFSTYGFEFNDVLESVRHSVHIVALASGKRFLLPLGAWMSLTTQSQTELVRMLEIAHEGKGKPGRRKKSREVIEPGVDRLPLSKDMIKGLNPIDVRAQVLNNPNFEEYIPPVKVPKNDPLAK